MPKRYPIEFKRDVVHVARTSGLTHAQIAEDFGISEHSVQRWLRQANIDDGVVEGTTTSEQDELTALRRRNRVLGHVCSENRVARLCSLQQIASSVPRKRRGRAKTPGPPVHDDHVNRDFHPDGLDEIWLTDITEHPTGRVSSTSARSRTSAPDGSWATPWATG